MNTSPKRTKSSIPEKRARPPGDEGSPTHGPAACLDCRSRKVKCNRQLPECSNCKRSGVPCRFPNPEKKASQMKQLTEDVVQFNGRLGNIEKSLAGRMKELTELVTQSLDHCARINRDSLERSSPQSFSELDDSDLENDEPMDFGSPHSSNTSYSSDRPSSVIVANGPEERFYGPCSTYSHMVHSKGLVEKLLSFSEQPIATSAERRNSNLDSRSATLVKGAAAFTEIRRKYDSFPSPSNFQESFETGHERPLELPPRQILEDSIEDYTSEYRLEPPLFDKQALAVAVAKQYSADSSELDESWVLCFNNIILRSHGWRSRAFRFNSFAPSRVDTNVLNLLLGNANRALRQLEKFCGLRLVNVQALLLLAFVGRDLIHYNVFARIFDRVCQLAKQMGLHERQNVGDEDSTEDAQAQNVLWNLYLVDKQNIFIRGPPCRIYEFECNMRLQSEDTVAQQFVSAHLRLSCLIEEVYRHLYSPKSTKLAPAARQQRVERLDGRLATLTHRIDAFARSAESGFENNLMQSHLKYACSVTRLLILSRSSAKRSKQIRRETGRSALQIVQTLSEGGFGFDGGIIVLERLFCNYSVIAFHEIFEGLVSEGPSSNTSADLELLAATTRTLKLISQADRPFSYCTRLQKNFAWCTEIATLICDSRRSTPASPANRQAVPCEESTSSSRSSNSGGMHRPHRYSNSVQSRATPNNLSQISSHRNTPSQDLSGDTAMQDDMFGSASLNPAITAAVSGLPVMNARDTPATAADFARMQSSLQPQDFMFAGGSDDFDLGRNAVMPSQFAQPTSDLSSTIPFENSARFQEALKYVLSMGGGADFDAGFQQAMGDQAAGMMQYNRNVTRPSNGQ